MRNYNIILILVSLFVLRIIVFSSTYADAICLLGLLAFLISKKIVENKAIESDVMLKIKNHDEQMKYIADELTKVKNSSEGLKAAINLTSKR